MLSFKSIRWIKNLSLFNPIINNWKIEFNLFMYIRFISTLESDIFRSAKSLFGPLFTCQLDDEY